MKMWAVIALAGALLLPLLMGVNSLMDLRSERDALQKALETTQESLKHEQAQRQELSAAVEERELRVRALQGEVRVFRQELDKWKALPHVKEYLETCIPRELLDSLPGGMRWEAC